MKTTIVSTLAFLVLSNVCHAQETYSDHMYEDNYTRFSSEAASDDYSDYGGVHRDMPHAEIRPEDNVYVSGDTYPTGRFVNGRPQHIRQDRLTREEYDTRVMREQARRQHMDNSVGRDESFTELYGSTNRAQERKNIMDNINQASETIRNVSTTIKYIEQLF